jgi:hypothetical protein
VDLEQASLNSVRLKLGVMGKACRFQERSTSADVSMKFEEVPLAHEVYPYSRRVYLLANTIGQENTTTTTTTPTTGVSTTMSSTPEPTPAHPSPSRTSPSQSVPSTLLKQVTDNVMHLFVEKGLLQQEWHNIAKVAIKEQSVGIAVTELPAYPMPGGVYIVPKLSSFGSFTSITNVPKAAQCQVYMMRNGGRAMKKPVQAFKRMSAASEDSSEGSIGDKKTLPQAFQWLCSGKFQCNNINCPSAVLGEDGEVMSCNTTMWSYTGKLVKVDGSNVMCAACKEPAVYLGRCDYKWCSLSTPGEDYGVVLVGPAKHTHDVKPVDMCTSMGRQSVGRLDMKQMHEDNGSTGVGTLRQNLASKYLGDQRAGNYHTACKAISVKFRNVDQA